MVSSSQQTDSHAGGPVSEAAFDIVSPTFQANPAHTLERIREAGSPFIRLKLPIVGSMLLCVTHDSCGAILKDKNTFVRDPGNAGSRTQERILKILPRSIGLLALNMLGKDDPEHRQLRQLVDQAFQRRGIEALRPMITAAADRLLDRLESHREIDLMETFCRDLPLSVICEMLGLPDRDHERFKSWLGGLKDTADIGAVIRAIPGVLRVVRYLREASRRDGSAQQDGLILGLRDAEIEGRRLSEDEIVSMIFLLFGAGQETTTHLIAGGLLEILRHHDQRGQLQADPKRIPLCVEECLRQVSPVQLTKPRWAAREIVLAGHRFKRGDSVAAFLTAANRDPGVFEDPHRFDTTRHPNPHLSFGTGVHFCLGFQLARAEATIAFERLFGRFPDVQLAIDAASLAWRKRLGIRTLVKLPVKLR
jgi:cytochrome P450